MQAAHVGYQLVAGAEREMISVGEDETCPRLFELLRRQPLDRRLCADRHEHRRFDGAMGRL